MLVLLTSILFFIVAAIGSIIFYKRIVEAKTNYEQSKDTFRDISSYYRRRVDDQDQKIARFDARIGALEEKVESLTRSNKQIGDRLEALTEKVGGISRVRRVHVKQPSPRGLLTAAIAPQGLVSTETEESVLKTLINEGSKTASQIQTIIGKSREHTARLMKKLYEEGYIERDTRRIPFVYRPTRELRELMKKRKED